MSWAKQLLQEHRKMRRVAPGVARALELLMAAAVIDLAGLGASILFDDYRAFGGGLIICMLLAIAGSIMVLRPSSWRPSRDSDC